MTTRGARTGWSRRSAAMVLGLLGLLGCPGTTDPWPEPPPSTVHYLTVLPRDFDIHVADPRAPVVAHLSAFVQDRYGRNIDDRTTRFAITSGGPSLAVAPIGAHPDQVALTVSPVCDAFTPCTPAPVDGVLTATHSVSGLTIDIRIRVRYDDGGVDGVAAKPLGANPMHGIASGRVGGTWKSRIMRSFVGRAGFEKFDAGVVVMPEADPAGGTVLSTSYAAWRRTHTWGTAPYDVTVPSATPRSGIRLKARYAADAGAFTVNELPFRTAVEAGADLISYTPIGALATLEGAITAVPTVEWVGSCEALGNELATKLAAADQPEKNVISIYMVPFATTATEANRAVHCGPGKLGPTPAFAEAHVVVLPQGNAVAPTVAHEIGHALALGHVTFGSGFHDDNLMVQTDELSAPMRFRLSIGQAWRAAFHKSSYIVTAGQAKSPALDCLGEPAKCPGIASDIRGRVP